jgi:hypothetical protein
MVLKSNNRSTILSYPMQRYLLWSVVVFLALQLIPRSGCAQNMATAGGAVSQSKEISTAAKPNDTDTPVTQSFGGLALGVGLGLSVNLQNQHRVTSASVVPPNNIVRVTQTNDVTAGIVLESHYFFIPNRPFYWGTAQVDPGDWGHGPFIAIEAASGSNTTITGYAIGWMIGFRQPTYTYDATKKWTKTYSRNSWNFGLSIRVDPGAQVLGDGIVANQPLPTGETTVRYNHVARYGLILVSSFSF